MPPQNLSQVSLFGPGGGGGGDASRPLIEAMVAEQQKSSQKLAQQLARLQQANMQAQQQAREGMASGVTEALNTVVRGVEGRRREREAKEERGEERAYREDMARLQARLQGDIAKEATRVGESIRLQRESALRFLDKFEADKETMQTGMEAAHGRLNELWQSGYFDQFPDGIGRYMGMKHQLNDAEARGDNHYSDDNVAAVYRKLNQTVQDITAGRDAMDLSALRQDPLLLPFPATARSSRPVMTPMDPERQFDRKMTNGYPPEGIVFGGAEEGEQPKLLDPDTFREVLFYDSFLTQLTDDRSRRRMMNMLNRTVMDANQRLTPMHERYKETNRLMGSVAPQAIQKGIEQFVAMPGGDKFNDVPRTLFALSMANVFPEKGPELAQLALDVFDGKKELSTAQQYWVAMGLESAAFNIQNYVVGELQKPTTVTDKHGNVVSRPTLSGALVSQMVQNVGQAQTAESLGLSPNVDLLSGEGLVLAQRAMTAQLTDFKAFAERVHRGLQRESALEGFRKQFGKNVRMADILAQHRFLTEEDDRGKAAEMMQASIKGAVEGLPMGATTQQPIQQTPEFKRSLGLMDAMILLADEAGPDTMREIAVAVSGGAENLPAPNLGAYQKTTQGESDRSRWIKEAVDRTTRNRKRQLKAKAAERERPTIGQAFEQAGVGGAALLGAEKIGRGIKEFGQRTAVGTATLVGGRKAGEATLRGIRGLQGRPTQPPQPPQQPQQPGQPGQQPGGGQ